MGKKAWAKAQVAKAINIWEENRIKEVLKLPKGEREKASWKLLSNYIKCHKYREQPTLKSGNKLLMKDNEVEQEILNFWHPIIQKLGTNQTNHHPNIISEVGGTGKPPYQTRRGEKGNW